MKIHCPDCYSSRIGILQDPLIHALVCQSCGAYFSPRDAIAEIEEKKEE